MSRRKLEKFSDNESRANVIQEGKELFSKIKGNWRTLYFNNSNPIVLELGCGRGEYTVGMARLDPDTNFVGIDIKGDRIWKGSKTAAQENLQNVCFLRTQVQSLQEFFQLHEVNEIWITFPDPRPKKSDVKRRLTHPRFLEIYRTVLEPGGKVHLKTDNAVIFNYTLEILQEIEGVRDLQYTEDLYLSNMVNPILKIPTHYERLFADQGFSIKYLNFSFE